MKNYLNFETDIKNLEIELDKLKDPYNQDGLSEVDTNKITDLQNEIDKKLKDVYSNLDAWQTTLVARHEDRPKSKFFIDNLFDEFISLCIFDIFSVFTSDNPSSFLYGSFNFSKSLSKFFISVSKFK